MKTNETIEALLRSELHTFVDKMQEAVNTENKRSFSSWYRLYCEGCRHLLEYGKVPRQELRERVKGLQKQMGYER